MTTAAEMRDALLMDIKPRTAPVNLPHWESRLDALIAKVEAETRAGLVEALEQVMDLIASGRDGYAFDTARAALAALATPPAPEPDGIAEAMQRNDFLHTLDLALASNGYPGLPVLAILRDIEAGGYTYRLTDRALALPAPEPSSGAAPVEERSVEGMPEGASFAWHSESHGPDGVCHGCRDHIGWHMQQCVCKERPWCVPHPSDAAHQWASLCRLPHDHVDHTPAPRSAGAGDGRTDR